MLVGGILGALTALVLTAIYYLFEQIAGLPFIPFDLFDQLARVLPGGIITAFIQSMVAVIRGLNLGATAEVAKLIEQSMAILSAMILGATSGVVLTALLQHHRWSGYRVGAAFGFLLFVPTAAVEVGVDETNAIAAVSWIAVTTIGWGALLGILVEGTVQRGQPPERAGEPVLSRRAFLTRTAAGSVALVVAFFGLARYSRDLTQPTGADKPLSSLAGFTAPSPPTPALPARSLQPVQGTRPEVTPNDQFYRIDIDLGPPTIHEDSWRLEVDGLFDRPRPLALADLTAYPAVTQPLTLSCISNPVAGDLIGNTYWTGLRIADLMKDLGLRPEATALRIESADDFYEIVTRADLDDPRALLVYGMNGRTLPVEHGFPLRILIPNRYGMKQPKWITHFTAIDRPELGYWVERGWNQEARPQIVSVIDTVGTGHVQGARVPLGGIAWAGDRGIKRVEVQVDGGKWEEADLLNPPLGPLTWVEWRYDWPAVAGRHTFRVRATDGTGALQVEREDPPEPAGATGYHSVTQTI